MDAFVTRRKRKSEASEDDENNGASAVEREEEESTDVKLAILASLHPTLDQEVLLDILLAHDGSVEEASAALRVAPPEATKRTRKSQPGGSSSVVGAQTSLRFFAQATTSPGQKDGETTQPPKKARLLSKKGTTLHLYDPVDIAQHTPCTIIHDFLPVDEADALLRELLSEATSFQKITFKLFENVVSSPHTSAFFIGTAAEQLRQRREYVYNGARLEDVRRLTPGLERVAGRVADAVNAEVAARIKTRYPGGQKLKFQSPARWRPNAAFVNCYDGPRESVGWHSDQLTYLGPRAVIGSLSLGVAREFRVRRIVPRDEKEEKGKGNDRSKGKDDDKASGDAEGQIAIHLPHNSLLVMHAEMQEEWKHSVAPALTIDPHPVAGLKRINITYRDYREEFHPSLTPKCRCGIPTVLRVVRRKVENWGRYFWMCHAGNVPGKEGCSFFQWAEFDDDGNPVRDSVRRSEGVGLGKKVEEVDTSAEQPNVLDNCEGPLHNEEQ